MQWFYNYLSERNIRTRVSRSVSASATITSAVPQGSVLGPLLFQLYFRDIPTVASAIAAPFADDTLLYRNNCHGNRVTPCCGLGKDLALLSSWSTSSGVSFNAAKSAEFCIGPRVPDTGIQLDSKLITRHQTWRQLGVISGGTNTSTWCLQVLPERLPFAKCLHSATGYRQLSLDTLHRLD